MRYFYKKGERQNIWITKRWKNNRGNWTSPGNECHVLINFLKETPEGRYRFSYLLAVTETGDWESTVGRGGARRVGREKHYANFYRYASYSSFESFSLMSSPRKYYMKIPNCYSVTNAEP